MKAITVAAAAAFLGSVNADGWESWSSTPEADPKTTPEAETSTWSEWDSSKTPAPTTTSSYDPETTWTAWTTSTPVKETKTSSSDPSWSEWSTTSSKPDDSTKTTTKSSESWSEWSTTSSKPSESTKTTSKDGDYTWSEWESSTTSKPSVATSTSSWAEWDPVGTTTVTSTSTQWFTVTVYPADNGQSWSQWSEPTGASTSKVPDASKTPVVSSTVTSWGAWATPSVDADGCKIQVGVSYGAPVWYPTPVIATSANTTWAEWQSSTSSKPVVASSKTTDAWSDWVSTTTSKPAVATSKPAVATSKTTDAWSEWASTTTSKPAVATSKTTDAWSEWVSTTTSKPAVATSKTTESWSAWASTSSSKSSASSSATWSAGLSTSSSGITVKGDKFGMTYSPYTASSGCKDQSTVNADIAKLAGLGFSSVRVYSTDCSTLEFVGAAAKQYGIKIILGVFISNTGISGAQPQVDAIAKWAQWDLVELIVIGNEAVFSSYCSASDLAGFMSSAKASFKAAGFKGAISTTDELSIWQSQGAAWCDVVDVVTANLYAFFNPNTKAEDAGTFIQAQINDLSKVCPGKDVYVMESGWPSAGQCNGVACPSPENQATAIKGIQQAVGAKIVYFSFEDEAWKAPGQFGVEQHWGAADVFSSASSWGSW